MNQFEINRESLLSIIKSTVVRDGSVKLHSRPIFFKRMSEPIILRFLTPNTIAIQIELEARFGVVIPKILDKLSAAVTENLWKFAGVQVKKIELQVKDVYDEKENPESE